MREPLRGIVEQFYHRLAWAYDAAVWLMTCGQWYRWVRSSEHFITGEPVLDVGCGTGHLLEHLARKGMDVTGVDVSADDLQNGRNLNICSSPVIGKRSMKLCSEV